jgi:hypothetical protein
MLLLMQFTPTTYYFITLSHCGLVIRIPGYRSRDLGLDSRRYPERGPLSLVSITEELLEWKNNGLGSRKSRLTAVGIRCADHATFSVCKSWH